MGGQSRRFGQDKVHMKGAAGQSVTQELVLMLQGLGLEVLLSCNSQKSYSEFGLNIIQDTLPDHGPLGGLYSVLQAVPTQYVLLLSCDMPLVDQDMIQNMILKHESRAQICLYVRDVPHPFPAIYDISLVADIKESLHNGRLGLIQFIKSCHSLQSLSIENHTEKLMNINTLQDYTRYQNLISKN